MPSTQIHIYTEEYNNGVISIPLKDIEDLELTDEIIESLDFFMKYTNIKHDNVIIESRLL
ncbi:hypothetical protein Q0N58_14570 [Staphylococcus aureus]|nr:hypothetical protein [Staphylococcus aureus]